MLDGVRVYTSDQTHFSVARALDLLGFPPETLVILPSDERFRLHGAPVAAAVARDRAAGLMPFAIAAVAGSTNTGSVDLVGELADVAAAEDLWLHVDAAYGGGARLSARDRDRVTDLDRADSVTVDPHKWFFQAYDIGGLLVRDGAHLGQVVRRPGARVLPRRRDARRAADDDHDDHGDQLNFYKLSFEGTRRWRALKLWMSWKHLGTEGFGRLIEANDDLAALLARRCAESDDFEAIPATPELSVVCFRHLPGGREAAMALAARRARRPPGPTPDRARGLRRRLADDDPPARLDLAARRDRQLPLDRGRHRSAARDAPPPRRRDVLAEGRLERFGDLGREPPDPGGALAGQGREQDLGGARAAVGDRLLERGAARLAVGRDDDLDRQGQRRRVAPDRVAGGEQQVAPLDEPLERARQVRGVVPAVGVAGGQAQAARSLPAEPDLRTARTDGSGLHHGPIEPERRRIERHAGQRRAPRR